MIKKVIILLIILLAILPFVSCNVQAKVELVKAGKSGDFGYYIYLEDGIYRLEISEYLGNSLHPVIPSKIEGEKYDVLEIGAYAFQDTNIVSITLPNTLKKIGNNAFENCTSLKNIIIPNSVTEIGDWAFKGCASLSDITIPSSVKKAYCIFYKCSNLGIVTLESGMQKIPELLFSGAKSPNFKVVIPNTITEIETHAFSNSNINNIILPNTLKKIGNNAFENCTNLTSIVIPNRVT